MLGKSFLSTTMRTCIALLVVTTYKVNGQHILNKNARFNGWYNNIDQPQWGTPGQGLSRMTIPSYVDGISKPNTAGLPNAIEVSNMLMAGPSGIPSVRGRSVYFAFHGQHLADDMLDSRWYTCPNQYVNIPIPPVNGTFPPLGDVMPMYRASFVEGTGGSTNSPRIVDNHATAWIDGSVIYGNSNAWIQHLRSYVGGKLLGEAETDIPAFNRKELPLVNPIVSLERPPKVRNPEDEIGFGNPRGNENPFLMAIGVLWYRWHNYQADRYAALNPTWSDQQIFDSARRWVVATYQKISIYDWVPVMTGMNLEPYPGYNNFLDPSVAEEFAVAAMRSAHSLVPSGVVLRSNDCSPIDPLPDIYGPSEGEPALRLCNTYWQLQDAIKEDGISPIVLGMTSQAAETDDRIVVEDLREFLYGPLKRTRMDLEAVTIQRGRDAGLPTYNNVRRSFNMEPINNFQELNPSLPRMILDRLSELYNNNTELIEFYVGGLLESNDDLTGNIFSRVMINQFRRTRNSDRFWFENTENGVFSDQEIEEIRNTTMADIISAVTSLTNLQDNVFNITDSICPSSRVTTEMFNKPCTPNTGIDFFNGYWGKYVGIIVLLLLFPTITYFVMCMIAWKRQNSLSLQKKIAAAKSIKRASHAMSNLDGLEGVESFTAFEIEGENKSRRIIIILTATFIKILNTAGNELRKISLKTFKKTALFISRNKKRDFLVVRVPKEYDIVLRFQDAEERTTALELLKKFIEKNGVEVESYSMDEKALKMDAVTKEVRQILLESFFRKTFAEALQIEDDISGSETGRTMAVADCELTELELAESIGMKPNSLFVKQMFRLADTDSSGYLSFREFADLTILLMNGTPEQKTQMLFDMYDVDHSGEISRIEGREMIRSFLEMAGAKLTTKELDAAVSTIFREAGENKESITKDDFTSVMLKEHRSEFESARLSLPGFSKSMKKKSGERNYEKSVLRQTSKPDPEQNHDGTQLKKRESSKNKHLNNNDKSDNGVFLEAVSEKEEKTWLGRKWKSLKRNVENYRRHIFCMVIFYGITIALIGERAMYYAYGAEHSGIRRVSEWGVIISRATAAGVSFHFSFILLTMCRNLITFCRETFLKKFIPFDSAVAFHKQIAYVALVEALLHAFGHLVNIYHFCVHPLPVLACLFPKVIVDDGSDLPKNLMWWIFNTVPGTTGVLLLLTLAVMYVFAMQYSRRFCFRAFWITHHLYSVIYTLIIIHGSLGLLQAPVFHYYLIVPIIIYAIDKLITISRSKVEIPVVKAEPLPSGVLNLVFKRPSGFDYRSGQWVQIASLGLGPDEYHPFTLTSAPHERHLSLHIRSAGPWTTNLRNVYQSSLEQNLALPHLYLDGPFGEGHQDWYKYEVSVLVGAGIGVTPFASILKDIVHRANTQKGFQITCKKVYFIWVTRTQRHFEWLTEIIRELEETQGGSLVSTHIYITQFANKFDLRTTMLYICERYFQKVAGQSMFTGLKATTHFGRPQFEPFLDSLQTTHQGARTMGVFSCGPHGLTSGVEEACKNINKLNKVRFNHFFENF